MGRAPAVALAYMWWVQGIHLEDAHELLLSKRLCHPKLFAIREAAADVLYGGEAQVTTIRKFGSSRSEVVEVAGALSAPDRFSVSSLATSTRATRSVHAAPLRLCGRCASCVCHARNRARAWGR